MNGKDLKPEKAIIMMNAPSGIDALYKLYMNSILRKSSNHIKLVCINGKRIA